MAPEAHRSSENGFDAGADEHFELVGLKRQAFRGQLGRCELHQYIGPVFQTPQIGDRDWNVERRRQRIAYKPASGKPQKAHQQPISAPLRPPLWSQNIPAEVLVLHNVCELFAHVDGVHFYGLLLQIRTVEGDFFQQFFEDRMQPPRADIFRRFVYQRSEMGDLLQSILGEG